MAAIHYLPPSDTQQIFLIRCLCSLRTRARFKTLHIHIVYVLIKVKIKIYRCCMKIAFAPFNNFEMLFFCCFCSNRRRRSKKKYVRVSPKTGSPCILYFDQNVKSISLSPFGHVFPSLFRHFLLFLSLHLFIKLNMIARLFNCFKLVKTSIFMTLSDWCFSNISIVAVFVAIFTATLMCMCYCFFFYFPISLRVYLRCIR